MRLLLDTHAFLWWVAGDPKLTPVARETVEAADAVYVSAATAWEVATKYRIGKLPGAAAVAADMGRAVEAEGFSPLPISLRHGELAGSLPGPHCDPFDRMLIAQAILENLVLVSNEQPFDAYGVRRLW